MVLGKGKAQAGFTLVELLSVMAILGILAGLVAGPVTGLGSRGQATRLDGDRDGIRKAANAFNLEAFPEAYPVLEVSEGVTGNVSGIKEIDFKKGLPQDPNKNFVPNFLVKLPDSSALVSWRIDENSGNVFFAQDGSALIKPSNNRLDISATTSTPSATSDYVLELSMAKDEAAPEIMVIKIPAGYTLGGGFADANTVVGVLTATLDTDNQVDAGQTITFGGVMVVVDSDTWALVIDYNDYATTGTSTADIKTDNEAVRVHTIEVVRPSSDSAGTLTIDFERGSDTEGNQATEVWNLTLLGEMTKKLSGTFTLPSSTTSTSSGDASGIQAATDVTTSGFTVNAGGGTNVTTITTATLTANPSTSAVYRWAAEEPTSISPVVGTTEFFSDVPGTQGVLIK